MREIKRGESRNGQLALVKKFKDSLFKIYLVCFQKGLEELFV